VMQLRIVRLTISRFLVTITHLPLGSFLPVRRAEGNSLAKSIPPNIGFDLPVLRYRARVHAIPAAGLAARLYFKRYSDDAIDLCDVLSSFSPQAKVVSLHELCRVMGLASCAHLDQPNCLLDARLHIQSRQLSASISLIDCKCKNAAFSLECGSQWAALLAASVVSYVLLMMPSPRFAAANDFLPKCHLSISSRWVG
jgi:hypothetical protein